MDQLDLLVHREWLLCKVGEEATHQRILQLPYLLRYFATGSALFDLKSLRNPEKLNDGSGGSDDCCSVDAEGSALVGVRTFRLELEAWAGARVAYGSNSDTSADGRNEGVADDAGVARGKSFAGGFGRGASGGPT